MIQYARTAGIDLLEACATAGDRRAVEHGLIASPGARASLALFGEQLGGKRRDHRRTGQLAKTVIATLTIADGPGHCYDDLLKHTDEIAVAADWARVKDDLRSLCRAAHTYEQRRGRQGSVGFLEQTKREADAEPKSLLDVNGGVQKKEVKLPAHLMKMFPRCTAATRGGAPATGLRVCATITQLCVSQARGWRGRLLRQRCCLAAARLTTRGLIAKRRRRLW